MTELVYRTVKPRALIPTENELTARLRAPRSDFKNDIERALDELYRVIKPVYATARVKLKYTDCGVDFGFGEVRSKALIKNLGGAEEAFVIASTLGFGADRLIMSAKTSPSRAFILDACASALAEALMDIAESDAAEGLTVCKRFSPGYGDFPLSHQPNLLEFLDAGKRLGISIGESLLMTPHKSITAVIGIIS